MDKSAFPDPTFVISGPMHASRRHDSAHKHVTGTADYIDDLLNHPACSTARSACRTGRACRDRRHGPFREVAATPGVVWVFTGKDVPGINDVSSNGSHDEPLLAETKVEFHQQPIFAVIAETRDIARRAARKAKIEYRDLAHWSDIDGALKTAARWSPAR